MGLSQRKPQRLKDYDYSRNGAYFITICTVNRSNVLGEIVGFGIPDEPKVKLSSLGIKVSECIDFIGINNVNVNIHKYVIMPNHVHLIIYIENGSLKMLDDFALNNDGSSGMPNPTNGIIPKTISSFKRFTNKSCGVSFWKSHYYDHIIRDEEDYLRICQYVEENPIKWQDDEYYGEC